MHKGSRQTIKPGNQMKTKEIIPDTGQCDVKMHVLRYVSFRIQLNLQLGQLTQLLPLPLKRVYSNNIMKPVSKQLKSKCLLALHVIMNRADKYLRQRKLPCMILFLIVITGFVHIIWHQNECLRVGSKRPRLLTVPYADMWLHYSFTIHFCSSLL